MQLLRISLIVSSMVVVAESFLMTNPTTQPACAAGGHHATLQATPDPDTDVLKQSRWKNLNPKIKERITANRQRAIDNKKKREPASAKKRRAMMFFKQAQREKARASRVQRPTPLDQRAPLTDLQAGQELQGTVISLTPFGAYVDVGTEVDGLLHISQLTTEFFVESPRQILSPADVVTVRVRSVAPNKKKLHLTMLPPEVVEAELQDALEQEERIPLDEILPDDELWGEIKRVTDFGAYVEVGAVVDGFLHFMDHPSWEDGDHPSDYMSRGDRVRVWVLDVDAELKRVKLTAHRPVHLPGPRREIPGI